MTSSDWFERHPGLAFERHPHGVLVITISRPARHNAVDQALHRSLGRVWLDVDDDPDVRVAVITGEGDAFSAGGDLAWLDDTVGDHAAVVATMHEAAAIVERMTSCHKIIVSAINGAAVGAGLSVALMADISIAAREARISDGHLRLGVAAGDHAAIVWPLLCGMAKAKHLLLTSAFLDGATADRIGLVSMSVPRDELIVTAMRVATQIATGPQDAARFTKRAMNLWLDQARPSFHASLALEMLGFLGPDAAEGIAALRERRRPVFVEDPEPSP